MQFALHIVILSGARSAESKDLLPFVPHAAPKESRFFDFTTLRFVPLTMTG